MCLTYIVLLFKYFVTHRDDLDQTGSYSLYVYIHICIQISYIDSHIPVCFEGRKKDNTLVPWPTTKTQNC